MSPLGDTLATCAGLMFAVALASLLDQPAATFFTSVAGFLAGRMVMLPWKFEHLETQATLDRMLRELDAWEAENRQP